MSITKELTTIFQLGVALSAAGYYTIILNNSRMKSLVRINILIGALFILSLYEVNAQIPSDSSVAIPSDSSLVVKEYNNLEEALRNPNKVFRLNLSNQNLNTLPDSIWVKFKNLEYLSLKNDHLKEIPSGIGNLKNLQVLDLSNNDFKVLPKSFSRLENLREIYLNDEKKMDVNQSLKAIENLPNLTILHLENDNLKSIPKSLLHLTHLENLYLNKNRFHKIPMELEGLKNLNFIDLHDNRFRLNNQDSEYKGSGIMMRF